MQIFSGGSFAIDIISAAVLKIKSEFINEGTNLLIALLSGRVRLLGAITREAYLPHFWAVKAQLTPLFSSKTLRMKKGSPFSLRQDVPSLVLWLP